MQTRITPDTDTFYAVKPSMQEHLFSHFSMASHDGFFDDVSITFTDKTYPFDPLRRENYWRQTLKTMVLNGLDIRDNVCVFLNMSACFQDYDFGITKFILSVNSVVSFVDRLLSFNHFLLLLFIAIIIIIIIIIGINIFIIIIMSLFIDFFNTKFNVIVIAIILPVFNIEVEPCTTCTLSDLVLRSIGIELSTTFKAKFIQKIL